MFSNIFRWIRLGLRVASWHYLLGRMLPLIAGAFGLAVFGVFSEEMPRWFGGLLLPLVAGLLLVMTFLFLALLAVMGNVHERENSN